jgi:hypothetical protein
MGLSTFCQVVPEAVICSGMFLRGFMKVMNMVDGQNRKVNLDLRQHIINILFF